MENFEIIVALLLAIIAVVVVWLFICLKSGLQCIVAQHKSTWAHFDNVVSQLYGIKAEVGQTNGKIDGFIPWAKHLRQKADNLENAWACDMTLIVKLLKEIRIKNFLTQEINWGELTDEQQSEILYRLSHPVVESPFKPPFNPTCETTNKEG